MTKWIAHKVTDKLPKEKTHLCNGGPSQLIATLRRMAPKIQDTRQPTPETTFTEDTTMAAMGTYAGIKSAKPGDTLEYKRPAQMAMVKFENQVSAVRSYYRRNHGVKTEQKTLDGATIRVIVNGLVSQPLVSVPASGATVTPIKKPADAVAPLPAATAQLWLDTYARFITIAPGASDEMLAARADAAVAAYRVRFEQAAAAASEPKSA
jgi:hypothetical protein